MTDLLDRVEHDEQAEPPPRRHLDRRLESRKAPAQVEDGRPMAMALAMLAAAAGVIHLVMVPAHTAEFTPEGIAFAAAGWAQLLLAFLLWRRPSRRVLAVTIVANVGFIAVWAVSRTVGLPLGPDAGTAESVSSVDLTCVAIEGALVLLAVALLLRPRLALVGIPTALAMVIPLAVIFLTSLVLTSPEIRAHTHGTEGIAAAGAAGTVAADGHAHGGAGASGSNLLLPAASTGFSLLANGHHHAIQNLPMSPHTRSVLKHQLDITREVAAQYPTVADAEAAGYHRAGPYSPGLGAHYISYGDAAALNFDGVVDDNDLRHPLSIIYDGTDPTSPVAGFMYYATTGAPPEGFASDNDVWHFHETVCISYGANGEINSPFGADLPVTAAMCSAAGGFLIDSTQYMVHVWTVPGYDMVPGGFFAEENPALDCGDGTYWRLPPHQWVDHPLNICENGNV